MSEPAILILPGIWNSGPGHWQTLWEEAHPAYQRVQQADWDNPDRGDWVAALDQAVAGSRRPIFLVAHSLGCALVAHWAEGAAAGVAGALLVAPADVDFHRHTLPEFNSFSPMPLRPLPFPSIVVASRNDPYVAFAQARHFAHHWGSRLVDAGQAGHINAASNLGDWPAGHNLLAELIAQASG